MICDVATAQWYGVCRKSVRPSNRSCRIKSCHCQGHRRTGRPLPSSSKTGEYSSCPGGALDAKHVATRNPHNSGSVFYNYKGFFSVVLLAQVGADYKFIWIDTGGESHQSVGQLFGALELKECIDDNTIKFPDSDPLPNADRHTPYYILGDDAFSLRNFFHETLWQEGSGQ